MSETFAVSVNLVGIVRGVVHQVVEPGNALGCHGGHRNGHLRVVQPAAASKPEIGICPSATRGAACSHASMAGDHCCISSRPDFSGAVVPPASSKVCLRCRVRHRPESA